ncbi:MAG: outer membrane lipoprotein-sorting protein [Candidatus Marinimicrobia bacterium]|nr:outer membrane lipoprotein-sorting protein [Candidatus Neomarinimicrobiota bacterium]MBL7023742.1 outer membrane lipoprotein-sorting protein [Candidatus Neomarinimicrobiota bacterium]MBL7109588.1 outer membrane lipoprotein-sorting protein [Candidatus Neomarinimicrobiota bacterium]
MRKFYSTIFILMLCSTKLFATELTADAILDSMNTVMSPENSKATMKQVIVTTSGRERIFEYEYYSGNKGKNLLMRYIKPKKVKNNAFLIANNGDDITVYFPRTRRTRKLASHAKKQKVQGSDFSYEDFSGSESWKEDYTVKLFESSNKNLYSLEFIPKDDIITSYSKMQILVRKSDYYPTELKYYDDKGIHHKTLFLEDIRVIEEFPTAMAMRMVNHIEKTETRMEILDITYNITFDENFFTERNLKKGK